MSGLPTGRVTPFILSPSQDGQPTTKPTTPLILSLSKDDNTLPRFDKLTMSGLL
jgi:hypothetical protein